MPDRAPTYVSTFVEAISARPPTNVTMPIPGRRKAVSGHRGILTTSSIRYNTDPFNLLGRSLEYTFWVEPVREYRGIEVSLQLYKNVKGFWRLFAFTRTGMLLSLNLTTTRRRGLVLQLGQTIAMRARDISVVDRSQRADEAVDYLRRLGFDVSDAGELVLGTFDVRTGAFLDMTAPAFVLSFLQAALIVGHYQGNKGYALPFPRGQAPGGRRVSGRAALRHAIPAGLRWDVLERDNHMCRSCGMSPRKDGVILHIDHIQPYSRGGATVFENLQTLCRKCNGGRSNRSSQRVGVFDA